MGVSVAEDEAAVGHVVRQPLGLPTMRILLVEDSLVNQKVAVALLKREGHSVVVANDGREAIDAFVSQDFDLILMDVQMPEMDGFEATAAIRIEEKQTGGHIPIIAMTAYALKGDRERCLDAGMDNYVAKPIHAEDLLEAIAAVVGTSAKAKDPSKEEAAFDWNEAFRAVRGGVEMRKLVMETAVEEAPPLMAALRDAVADGNVSSVLQNAHTLKGLMRYFGDNPAATCAFELETMGRDGDVSGAEESFAALESEMEQFASTLHEHMQANGMVDESQA